ncbi:helix-turn-helix transcriptional regulator [uncultured Holdemania sp.]|uniref:helix-turn-helix domain-containing protein n=1 Tax=uncultured Holdemania sp. TaxID=527664 RepID=UPI0025F1123E|nr:helix-turn-helix transcriptional regulator [uncultured Holdemania sp.]
MKAKLSLGENLRLLREERGISQEALGQDLSLSDGAISRYENNVAEPDINTLFGMAEIFGVEFQLSVGLSWARAEKPGDRAAEQRRGAVELLSSMFLGASARDPDADQRTGAAGWAVAEAE